MVLKCINDENILGKTNEEFRDIISKLKEDEAIKLDLLRGPLAYQQYHKHAFQLFPDGSVVA